MTDTQDSLAGLLNTAVRHHAPQIINFDRIDLQDSYPSLMIAPDGMKPYDLKPYLDAYRTRPVRAKGTARLNDLDSLIQICDRFTAGDGERSALFCSLAAKSPSLTAIFNYNQAPVTEDLPVLPGFSDHRAVYDFPLSEEWQAWAALEGQKTSQTDFAAFLEDRINDVIHPPAILTGGAAPDGVALIGTDAATPKAGAGGDFGPRSFEEDLAAYLRLIGGHIAGPKSIMDLSRGLELTATAKVIEKRNLSSGQDALAYEETHSDKTGAPIKVPSLFLIDIPVFDGGSRYTMAVRLRYRLVNGTVIWFFNRARVKETFEAAIRQAAHHAAEQTALPLFFGTPEAI